MTVPIFLIVYGVGDNHGGCLVLGDAACSLADGITESEYKMIEDRNVWLCHPARQNCRLHEQGPAP